MPPIVRAMEDLTEKGPESVYAVPEPEVDAKQGSAEKAASSQRERRIFFFSFGAILFVGIALGVLYLSGRVMETKAAAKPESTQPPLAAMAVRHAAVPETKPPAAAATPVEAIKAPVAQPVPAPLPVAVAKAPAVEPVAPPRTVPVEKAAVERPKMATPPQAAPKPVVDSPVIAKATIPVAPVIHAAPKHEIAMDGNLTRAPKPYGGPFLKPNVGDTYVQVGAYSPNYTPSFLAILEKKGFHGVVAPGPAADVYRVLVGPFAERTAMKNTFAQLEKVGITDAFDRIY
jgi:cell division protein FtsN